VVADTIAIATDAHQGMMRCPAKNDLKANRGSKLHNQRGSSTMKPTQPMISTETPGSEPL